MGMEFACENKELPNLLNMEHRRQTVVIFIEYKHIKYENFSALYSFRIDVF